MIIDYELKYKDKLIELGKKLHDNFNAGFNEYTRCLLYLSNNTLVGFITFKIMYEKCEIEDIYIEEEYRRQGIGKKLLEEVEKKANKCENITLEVNENNSVAIKFYESLGFKFIAKRNNYYGKEDALLMEKKKDFYILAIETSCDETSASMVKNGKADLGAVILSQIDIDMSYGGVVQEIARSKHTTNITIVLEELLEKTNMKMNDIDVFAVTSGPGLNGSLLVGVEAAKTLAYIYKKPLIPVNHLAGHIYANNIENELIFPLLVLLVSGGHTELIHMDKHYSFKKLGGTLDDSVGEAYDKVARIIGLPYPGGPEIDKLANIGKHTYILPIPKDDNTNDFSFSGIKSAVINLVHNEKQRGNDINIENLCASFQEVVIDILIKKTIKLAKELNINNIILSGGVSANSLLRKNMKEICDKENIDLIYSSLKYSTDNATMIGAAAYYAYKENISANSSLNTNPNQKL